MSFTTTCPRPPGAGRRRICRSAHLSSRICGPDTVAVSVDGALDAANAADFHAFLGRSRRLGTHLVIDLSGVRFLGVQAGSVLIDLRDEIGGAPSRWAVVPSPAVRRTLRVCDPGNTIVTAPSLEGAVRMLRRSGGSGGTNCHRRQ